MYTLPAFFLNFEGLSRSEAPPFFSTMGHLKGWTGAGGAILQAPTSSASKMMINL